MSTEIKKQIYQFLQGELRRRSAKTAPVLVAVLAIAVFVLGDWGENSSTATARPTKGATLTCPIASVYDGDTVTANCRNGKVKVRVYGIDAPEMGQKPWGAESRDALKKLLPSGSVTIEVLDTDRYGRSVAKLKYGTKDLGLELVRAGRAIVYERYNDDPRYPPAQAEAKKARRGIWAKAGAQQTPEEWRRVNARN